jgi:phosphate starvation-inducible protein PhoH
VQPAGSGKTYTAIALAVNALKNKAVRKIVLSRPAVEAGEKLGFLPGDMKEKIDPYLQPLYDALEDMIPASKLRDYMSDGTIQIAPLAFMRGRTLSDAVVILDEAQNTTREQIKMFLTRMGMGSKMIVTGDVSQIDLPASQRSGLLEALKVLKSVKGIGLRTAQRIIVDLRDKMAASGLIADLQSSAAAAGMPVLSAEQNEVRDEAVGALTMLGFSPAPSQKVVVDILKAHPDLPVEQVIKQALKLIK